MSRSHVFTRLLMATVATAFLMPAVAQAGFEWRGSSAPPAAPTAASAQGEVITDQSYPEPVIMWQDNGVAPAPMPAQKIGTVESAPVLPPAAPVAVELAPSSASLAPNLPTPVMDKADNGQVVDGFGSDLPLAIALQQITPAGYQVSFGAGVSPGTSVSWEGGKPWKTVLSETLSAKGLNYVIDGNVIRVIEQRDAAFVSPAMPNVTGIESMPAMSGVAAPAAQGADALAIMKAPEKPVDIRRQKPTSLLHKMKSLGRKMTAEEEATLKEEERTKGDMPVVDQKEQAKTQATVTKSVTSDVVHPPAPPAAVAATANDISWNAAPANEVAMPMQITRDALTVLPVKEAVPPVTSGVTMSADTAQPGVVASATWHGAHGQTLRDVLKSWSDVAGVELYWSIDYDYRLQNDVGYPGSYDEAVGHLLDLFATVRPQPYGQLHQDNGNGARVLVIKSYDAAG